jgi:hypothetical protein
LDVARINGVEFAVDARFFHSIRDCCSGKGLEREVESKAFTRFVVCMTTLLVVLIEKHIG